VPASLGNFNHRTGVAQCLITATYLAATCEADEVRIAAVNVNDRLPLPANNGPIILYRARCVLPTQASQEESTHWARMCFFPIEDWTEH
jgi:hypothetical protein